MPTTTDAYTLGYFAALRGNPLDACRYHKPDHRNAWVRGWHEAQAAKAHKRLSDEEKARGRTRIQELKRLLE